MRLMEELIHIAVIENDATMYQVLKYFKSMGGGRDSCILALVAALRKERDGYKEQLLTHMERCTQPICIGSDK